MGHLILKSQGCTISKFRILQSPVTAMEFFLNIFTEFSKFSNKIFVITVKGLKPLPPSHLLCQRTGCYQSDRKTHVRDSIFELSLIHNSVKAMPHLGKTLMPCFFLQEGLSRSTQEIEKLPKRISSTGYQRFFFLAARTLTWFSHRLWKVEC